ncbi:MAG TPA: tyrosine-type recombinase/integrase [Candidatus Cybelea sp.]|nr:tyrosine-type recombinase/integrase [Candidatus Cybelea sp.]
MLRFVQRQGDYHYFRKAGTKPVRLPGAEGSPQYLAAYERALAKTEGKIKSASETQQLVESALAVAFLPGSLGWVIDQYQTHREFKSKAHGTQVAYAVSLKTMRSSPIARAPMRGLTRQHVNAHCEEIAKRLGPSRGDHQAMLLSILWSFADNHLPQCKLDVRNPTSKRKRAYEPTPRDAWSKAVCKRFLDGCSSELALAYALLFYTGQRRGDVCKMKWTDYDGKFIEVVQEKTGACVPVAVDCELKAILDKTERRGETILTTKTGKPFLATALTKAIKTRLRTIGEPNLVLHGLRKSAGVDLAEAGASVQQVMSVLGHKTPTMALYYCAQASKRKLSSDAMKLREKARERAA